MDQANLFTLKATKIPFHALIMAMLEYCNSIFTGLPQFVDENHQRIMNDAAGVITGASRRDEIAP